MSEIASWQNEDSQKPWIHIYIRITLSLLTKNDRSNVAYNDEGALMRLSYMSKSILIYLSE